MSDDIKTVTDVTKTSTDVEKQEAKKYDEEYVNTVKAESITRGKTIKELEDKLKKIEDEKLSDLEKKDKRIKELEDKDKDTQESIKASKIDNLILKKANGKNIIDIEALMMFAKKELASVEDVNDATVEAVISKILKDKPYLVSSTNIIPGDGNFKKTDNQPGKDPLNGFNRWLQKQYRR